eukprot:GGOE01004577.1.p1 GENE.GGOE01004577.1~~GGOE01004577.1.p1  ORF type:complete len:780 (-),score=183.35 GGOE01004577.1:751-3090(-)
MQCSLIDGKPPQVPQLVYLHHNPAESEQYLYALKDGVTSVGSEGEVRVYGEGIEPHHCDVHNVNGEVAVAAVNGVTFVNGRKVTALTPMGQGGRLIIGSLFFRLNNPNKKEWVNPPGYQYAYDEFKREQEIVSKRERRSRLLEDEEKKRRSTSKPSKHLVPVDPGRPPNAIAPPTAVDPLGAVEPPSAVASPSAVQPDKPTNLVEHSAESLVLAIPEEQLSPLLFCRNRESLDDEGQPSPHRPKMMLTRHLAATAAIRRPSLDIPRPGTYPLDSKHDEVSRIKQEFAEMEGAYRRQLEEQAKKLEEERRRSAELLKSVASLEKRLKEKVKQEMCERGEQLMTKMDEKVKEAQQLTNTVGKPVQFTMRLQTSWDESTLSVQTTGAGASFDAMQLDATVQVKDTRDPSKVVTMESQRFMALLQEMQQVHRRLTQAVENGEMYVLPHEEDPWEKLFLVEQYVGCTRILLEGLLYNMPIEDLSAFLTDNAGNKVGQVKLDVHPCSPEGIPIEDDDELLVDDNEVEATWLGKRWDVILAVRHLRIFNAHRYSHVFLGHTFWNDRQEYRSQAMKLEPGQTELVPNYTHQHTNPEVDPLFLEYLKSRNIQLKVYAHVLNPEYVPVSTADEQVRRAVIRSSKLLERRRSCTPLPVPDAPGDVERLEAQCAQQKALIGDLSSQLRTLQAQLAAAMEQSSKLEKELADRDTTVAELKQKKRELNQLLKSEKEKFLARQAQLKQKIASLQSKSVDSFPVAAGRIITSQPARLDDAKIECVNLELLRSVQG